VRNGDGSYCDFCSGVDGEKGRQQTANAEAGNKCDCAGHDRDQQKDEGEDHPEKNSVRGGDYTGRYLFT